VFGRPVFEYNEKLMLCLSHRALQSSASTETSDYGEVQGHALASFVGFIQEQRESCETSTGIPTFRMVDLEDRYGKELQSFGYTPSSIHSTRLKNRLLDACPYLQVSGKPGQDTLVTFCDDVDLHLRREAHRDFDGDALQLFNASKIVRSDIFYHENSDWAHVTAESQRECVPKSLLALVKMILHGPGRRRKVPEKVDSNAGGGNGEGSNGGGGEGEDNDGGGGEGDGNDGKWCHHLRSFCIFMLSKGRDTGSPRQQLAATSAIERLQFQWL